MPSSNNDVVSCKEVLEHILDLLEPVDPEDPDEEWLAPLRRHLTDCSTCQSAIERERRFNEVCRETFNAVEANDEIELWEHELAADQEELIALARSVRKRLFKARSKTSVKLMQRRLADLVAVESLLEAVAMAQDRSPSHTREEDPYLFAPGLEKLGYAARFSFYLKVYSATHAVLGLNLAASGQPSIPFGRIVLYQAGDVISEALIRRRDQGDVRLALPEDRPLVETWGDLSVEIVGDYMPYGESIDTSDP